jgi:phosphatidylglycerophosphate synthase
MLDGFMRKIIDPPLNVVGGVLGRRSIGADHVTFFGLAIGLAAAGAIVWKYYTLALVLVLISRIADGLDGAVARATQKTDFGGYLDIVADFVFYGAIPFAFILSDLSLNGIAGGFLLWSFYFNGATFLGYAILAEKYKMKTDSRGSKSLYFTGGLLEGTETIALFCVFCLWPSGFAILSYIFGGLVFITAISRVILAKQVFGGLFKDP